MTIFSRSPQLRAWTAAITSIALLIPTSIPSYAQGPMPDPGPPPDQVAMAPAFSRQKLEQLAAPIALYPDGLLTQVMMAATYPLDVVQASRWRRSNPGLRGAALQQALERQPWDESVKSVVAFNDVIRMMDEKIDWTEQLGEAFLAQEEQLFQAVQDLRAQAEQAGNLNSTRQQRVTRSGSYYVIEPADPELVYVPVYEPAVYGTWRYPDYPPYNWYPRRRPSDGLIWFGVAAVAGAAIWASWDWNRRRLAVDPARYNQFNRRSPPITTWNHDPSRRRGAPYRAPVLVNKFNAGQPPQAQGGRPGVGGRPPQFRNNNQPVGPAPKGGAPVLQKAPPSGAPPTAPPIKAGPPIRGPGAGTPQGLPKGPPANGPAVKGPGGSPPSRTPPQIGTPQRQPSIAPPQPRVRQAPVAPRPQAQQPVSRPPPPPRAAPPPPRAAPPPPRPRTPPPPPKQAQPVPK